MRSVMKGVGGGGGGLNYLHAHIHLRFRHAHHKTKDWLPNLGSWGGKGKKKGAIEIFWLKSKFEVISDQFRWATKINGVRLFTKIK